MEYSKPKICFQRERIYKGPEQLKQWLAYDHVAQPAADNPPVGCIRDEVHLPDKGI